MGRSLLAAALAAFVLSAAVPAAAAGPIRIVAAENFYGALAGQIGGDAVEVTSILSSPDQDPHLFEASPSTARALAGADIVIYNGAGYDGWIDRLLSASARPDADLIVAAKLVGATTGDNPHLWYKPKTFPAVAEALADDLSAMAPEHAARFAANLRTFEKSFAAVQDTVQTIRKRYSGTKVTATEPVFNDMAEALGFDIENTAFQLAMMNDTEPGPQTVAAFEKSLGDGSIRLLFYNSQVSDPAAERLVAEARRNGVAVVGVTETMPRGVTIAGWLSNQLEAVEGALRKAGG